MWIIHQADDSYEMLSYFLGGKKEKNECRLLQFRLVL